MDLYPHVYDEDSLGLFLIIAPAIWLLCWLYNAHRLGKFKKAKYAGPRGSIEKKSSRKKLLFIICGTGIGVLTGFALRFLL